MSLEMLLAQFDGLLQTPADVEKLNGAILQWAVEGRLVPQCANDDPASWLLKQIVSAKDELEDVRKSKRNQQVKPISKDEVPYILPPTCLTDKTQNGVLSKT
ncbi:MAG: hypothetical protein H6668_20660 [Ardenticatenaceae bacterium]|nr:hypothetical protein [Ardenticatenaceae bacterium]